MVTEADLTPVLESVGNAYPSFRGWYFGLSDQQRQGMKSAWTRQLSTLQADDVSFAVGEILDGRVEMPKNYEYDRLGSLLRTWGGVAAAKRIEAENTERLRDLAKPDADRSVKAVNYRFGPAVKCASAWGAAVRAGHVTQSENDDAMAVVHQYHKVGDVELIWPQVPLTEQKSIVDFWKAPRIKDKEGQC